MIDKRKLQSILQEYKKAFPKLFWTDKQNNEKYKWVAIKHFQVNWDIDAPDFLDMFTQATAKTENLLAAMNYFPRGMIIEFCKVAPEDVRKMFRDLFDESKSVVTRVEEFIKESERLRTTYQPESGWKSHYQNTNSITTYLWLMYPDKYYIYKYSECRAVAYAISNDYKPTKGAKPETLLGAISLYDEIAEFCNTDSELVRMLRTALDDTCYADPKLRTLAIDIGFYISRHYSQKEPAATNSVDHAWYVGAVINNQDMLDTFVAEERWQNGYAEKYTDDVKKMQVGDKIVIKAAYTRKNVPFKTNGTTVSVMGIKAYGTITDNPGDGQNVKVKWEKVFEPIKEWYFFTARNTLWHVVRQADDWVYGALLDFTFLDAPQDYDRFLEMPFWKDRYAVVENDPEEVISDISEEEPPKRIELPVRQPRTNKLHTMNTILYGAPGTGKTYSTAEYAMAIIEGRPVRTGKMTVEERQEILKAYKENTKSGRIVFTTFHQNYGYEEFIQGLRPSHDSGALSFVKADGVFKKMVEAAIGDHDNNYVFIIDEINRANISKVFGELITLIEEDKRWGEFNELSVTLPMGDIFAIPNNLYIIGTMNTADKSISLIDTALRRRFDFVEVPPAPEFVGNSVLRNVLETINAKLADELESSDLLIGHAYFIGKTEDDLAEIMNRNIIPLLYEYFYDNAKKVKTIVDKALEGLNYKVVAEKTRRIYVAKKD